MSERLTTLAGSVLVVLAVGCSGDLPSGFSLPSCDDLENANPRRESAAWVLFGFSNSQLLDPNAPGPDFVARIHRGEIVDLVVGAPAGSCNDRLASVDWISTDPSVAAMRRHGSDRARVRAVSVGETTVYADIRFKNGNTFRAFPFPVTSGFPRPGLIKIVQVVP